MKVKGLVWLGTRTPRVEETVRLFRDVLGLKVTGEEEGLTVLSFPNGDQVEVFSADEREHTFFTTGPVVGFLVDDVAAAREELTASGVELMGGVHSSPGGYAWQHFRGPDGNVYEITSGPYAP